MEYLGILGFAIGGYLLPELCKVLGDSSFSVHAQFSIASAMSAGLISASFLIN